MRKEVRTTTNPPKTTTNPPTYQAKLISACKHNTGLNLLCFECFVYYIRALIIAQRSHHNYKAHTHTYRGAVGNTVACLIDR